MNRESLANKLVKASNELIRIAAPQILLPIDSSCPRQYVFEVTDYENRDGKVSFGIDLMLSDEDRVHLMDVELKEDGDSNGALDGLGVSDIFCCPNVVLDMMAVGLDRIDADKLFSPIEPKVTIQKEHITCCKILLVGWTPPTPEPAVRTLNIGGV